MILNRPAKLWTLREATPKSLPRASGHGPEVAVLYEAALAASQRWIEHKNFPISKRDHHCLQWLLEVRHAVSKQRNAAIFAKN
jgi:hypothetical protein